MYDRLLKPFSPTSPDDDESVAIFNRLTRSAYGMAPEQTTKSIDNEWQVFEMHNAGFDTYHAVIDGDPVAVAARTRLVGYGRTLEISAIAVTPYLRGRGIGTRVVGELVQIARDTEASSVKVIALEEAIPIYIRNGFQFKEKDRGYTFLELCLGGQ